MVIGGGGAGLAAAVAAMEEGARDVIVLESRRSTGGNSSLAAGAFSVGGPGQIRFDSRSIVIATGGFAGNRELIKKYFPDFKEDDVVPLGGIPHQGDGLLMAREIGAGLDGFAFLEMSLFVFGDPRHLQPITIPPFYGIRHGVSLLATHGDLRVNHHMEVRDKEDNTIPGLFAAGDDTGSVDSDTYNMDLPGHSFGFAINTGRIAGENAVKYVAADRNDH